RMHCFVEEQQYGRTSEADHPCFAGSLRRGAVPLPGAFAGRMECNPLARRRCADRPPDGPGQARMTGWRPGDRRRAAKSMVRVDQAGEYGATRIYAGQLAVLRRNCPAAKLLPPMA